MPRYYFPAREDDTSIPDDEGFELPDLSAAEREALLTLACMGRDLLPTGEVSSVTIEVWTEDRRRVLAATLTLHIERSDIPPH